MAARKKKQVRKGVSNTGKVLGASASKKTSKKEASKKASGKTLKKTTSKGKTSVESVEPAWEVGDWAWDATEDPHWDDPSIKRRRVGADEIPALADAVVRGASLTFCVIEDLRALVDAVQAHPDARLARAEEGDDGHLRAVGVFDRSGNKIADEPTSLAMWGCVIESCDLSYLDIGCTLKVAARFPASALFGDARFAAVVSFSNARFIDGAGFGWSRFAANAWFDGSRFGDGAEFGMARFAADVNFDGARFAAAARFGGSSFGATAWFAGARFAADAWFDGSRFADAWFGRVRFAAHASFFRSRFAADAGFGSARFEGRVCFQDAEINRRLVLVGAAFESGSRLDIADIVVRAGASLHLDTTQLNMIAPDPVGEQDWARQEAEAIERWAAEPVSVRVAMRQYVEASVVMPGPWILERAPLGLKTLVRMIWRVVGSGELPFGLGLILRGRLIDGEDSEDKAQLAKAAESYNLLRDIFRAQPSTDAHEEICAIRHHDLVRRGKPRPHWWSHIPGFFHWLVMRNMLGYLMNPWRPIITGAVLMLGFGFFYLAYIGQGDIAHGDFPRDAAGAFAYWKSQTLNPFYFSMTTFVTLGYGDFAPKDG